MSKWQKELIDKISINIDNIPKELLDLKQWVSWGGSILEDGSPDKKPINPHTNRAASSVDPNSWGSFDDAVHCVNTYNRYGVGFVFSKDDEFVGIDLDDCVDDKGNINQETMELIKSFNSYTEYSPSGRGIHIIVRGSIPENKGRKKGWLEIYKVGRYFTVTGNSIIYKNIESCQASIDAFMKIYFPPDSIDNTVKLDMIKRSSLDDMALIEKIKNSNVGELWSGFWEGAYKSQSEADLALINALAFWCGNDPIRMQRMFNMSGLYRDKKSSRKDYLPNSIKKVLANPKKPYDPDFYKDKDVSPIKVIDPNEIDVNKPELIEFPDWVMGGLAKEFSDLYVDSIEVPSIFLYFGFLTCMGSILSDKISIDLEIRPQPRFYCVFLGESASDRKSTALKKLMNFFSNGKDSMDRNALDESSVCWGVGSAEGLGKKFEDNKKIVLCYDELKHFVQKSKISSSVLLPCVGELFENNRYSNNTKTTQINMENAYLSVIAASTVGTYETMFTNTFTDIGFVNRLFIVPGRATKRIALPPTVDEFAINAVKAKMLNIFWKIGNFTKMGIDKNAAAMYSDWYNNLEKSSHTKRLDTYAIKLMMLIAINEFKDEIDLEIVEKVIAIGNWQLAVRKVYDPIDADGKTAEMEQRIRRMFENDHAIVTERNMKRALYRHIKIKGITFYQAAIKNLLSQNEIVAVKVGKAKAYQVVDLDLKE